MCVHALLTSIIDQSPRSYRKGHQHVIIIIILISSNIVILKSQLESSESLRFKKYPLPNHNATVNWYAKGAMMTNRLSYTAIKSSQIKSYEK